MALTIKEIDGAKPTDKSYKLADGGGLCLLIPPSGAKLWADYIDAQLDKGRKASAPKPTSLRQTKPL